jgi:hypothetical protein
MKSGYIYILSNPAFKENLLKIGYTTNNAPTRAKQLYTTGVPAKYKIVYTEDVDNPKEIETKIHRKLADFRYNEDREFFNLPIREAISKVQEVTQREIYKNGLHILDENMNFRWLCKPKDFIVLTRYITLAHALTNNLSIVDFWICKEGDQVLINNRKGTDSFIVDDEEVISINLNKSQSNNDINAINGIIHGLGKIYPGDRIIWLSKVNNNSNTDEDYYIHCLLDCREYANLAGFSDPCKVIHIHGIPADFGYIPEEPKLPNILHQAFKEIKELGIPDTWGSPTLE